MQNYLNSHHYLVRKFGTKDSLFDINEMLKQINDRFCIQCENYIPEMEIDSHSLKCSGSVDQLNLAELLQERLAKCNLLIKKIKSILKGYSSHEQTLIQYLYLLWVCVQQIHKSTDHFELQDLLNDLEHFKNFFENYQTSDIELILQQIMNVFNKIYEFSERKQKLYIASNLKDSAAISVVNEQKHIVMHDNQLNRYRNPFENMSNNIHQSLRNTFHNYNTTQQFNMITPKVEIQDYNSSYIENINEKSILDQSPIKDEAERKQAFFKIAKDLKAKYMSKQQVQQALIIALYTEAKQKGISENNYKNYIEQLYSSM